MSLKICMVMINRGRYANSTVSLISEMIKRSDDIICILGESDSQEKAIGLDGRKVLEDIIKVSGRNDYRIVASEDDRVGTNALVFGDLKISSYKWKCINLNNLKHPQSSSERYRHYRLQLQIKLGKELAALLSVNNICILAQHQSAFIRPVSRYRQARGILRTFKNLDKKDCLSFILRDQNSFIPGEGFLERQLRKRYGMHDLTKRFKNTYKAANIETDQNDFMHKFVSKVYNNGWGRIIAKVVTNTDKIDSILGEKEFVKDYIFDSFDIDLPYLDHDLMGVEIFKKREVFV